MAHNYIREKRHFSYSRIVSGNNPEYTIMNPKTQIVWQGDLNDDCLSKWNGLLLRAENMDNENWWWCVYDTYNGEIQIDSSNNHSTKVNSGEYARKLAEDCARKFMVKQTTEKNRKVIVDNDTLDAPEIELRENSFLKDLILWWEKKRLYYNLVLLLVIGYDFYIMWYKVEIIGYINSVWEALYFLFGANLFYTLGWAPSALVHLATKYDNANLFGRWLLFVLGTLFSIFWMSMILREALFFG